MDDPETNSNNNGDNNQEEESSKKLTQSNSTEFNYTSFGAVVKNDELDDQNQNSIQNQIESEPVSNQDDAENNNSNIEEKVSEKETEVVQEKDVDLKIAKLNLNDNDESESEPGTQSSSSARSDDSISIKNLPFDQVIERVRQNRASNKDICNYVLNLLVDGEFDLEKNFVIKNYKSILLMIQVIKCATLSLKVEFFFLIIDN